MIPLHAVIVDRPCHLVQDRVACFKLVSKSAFILTWPPQVVRWFIDNLRLNCQKMGLRLCSIKNSFVMIKKEF